MKIFKAIKIIFIVIRNHWRAYIELDRTLDKLTKIFNKKWYKEITRKKLEEL